MSDTYHYDEGAIHNDHKRVIHIDTIGGADLGKLIGAFFNNNTEVKRDFESSRLQDFETLGLQDNEAMERAAVLTENAEFLAIMQKAVEQGFCTQDGWQYRWKEKIDAVYFASEASHKFHISRRHDPDGGLAISWKPFEVLFGEKGFRSKYNDYLQGKIKLHHKEEIDKLFR
jgi:hypothetical protein